MTGPSGALIQLRTLGSVDLRAQDGSQITAVVRQPKRLGLLVYLALHGQAFQRRDRVLALFWPESDEKSARGSLSQAVFQLRAALGRNAILSRGDDELALNPEAVWCDVAEFQQALLSGNPARAMELYRGELLPSFTVDEAPEFEDWLAQRRRELSAQAAGACRQLADDEERGRNFDGAVEWLRAAIAIQPFNESLHQRLIQVLDRNGDRAAALHAFEELRSMLRNEFDAEPAAESIELIESVRTRAPGARREATPTYSPDAPAGVGAFAPARPWRTAIAVLVALVAVGVIAFTFWPAKKAHALALDHVAVLYFNDESPNRDLGYLAESLTSTLIDQLGQVRQLQVISQNGVRQFAGSKTPLDSIARELAVGTIVGGSVTRSGDRLRVTVELINGATGVAVRSRTLERPVGELFALLDDISTEVSGFLRSTVGQQVRLVAWRAQTRNVDAWRALQKAEYMRSLAEQTDRSGRNPLETSALLAQADSLARQALTLDRSFVSAVVLRSAVAERRAWLSLVAEQPPHPGTWLTQARDLANQAVMMDNRSADAYEMRGIVEQSEWLLGEHSLPPDSLLGAAHADLSKAIALGGERPRAESILSAVLYVQGRFAEARMAAQRALDADAYLTDADQIVNRLFQTSFELGDDAEAGHWCDEVRRRFVGHWPAAWCDLQLLAWSREGNHDPRKAMHLLENFGAADPKPLRDAMQPRLAVLTAAVMARSGMRDSANAMLARAHAQAPRDIELLHLEAAARLQMHDDARAIELLRDYLRLNPANRALMLNSRIFAPLSSRIN